MSEIHWCAGFRVTPHALKRQREMGIPDTELALCLTQPEQTYTQRDYASGTKVYQRGRISAVVKRNHVLTVLWKTDKEYKRKKP